MGFESLESLEEVVHSGSGQLWFMVFRVLGLRGLRGLGLWDFWGLGFGGLGLGL